MPAQQDVPKKGPLYTVSRNLELITQIIFLLFAEDSNFKIVQITGFANTDPEKKYIYTKDIKEWNPLSL